MAAPRTDAEKLHFNGVIDLELKVKATSTPEPLTEEQKEHFRRRGFVHLKNCFSKEQAAEITKDVWARLGMDPSDKSTWTKLRTNMPNHNGYMASDFSPKAWAAITELCGGEDRVSEQCRQWRDGLIVNLGSPEMEGKEVPPQSLDGWHVDGDFFVHYLDSPEQGLLVIPLFTDIIPGGGGTVICPEAMPKVAKHLYENPEGVSPMMRPRSHDKFEEQGNTTWFNELAATCTDFVEVTGEVGDVFLLHPLMLHSASTNPRRQARIITNPPVSLKEPFNFNRQDGNYSIVEQTTLQMLGKESMPNWTIQKPREKVTPKRWKDMAKMKEAERMRMEEARKMGTVA